MAWLSLVHLNCVVPASQPAQRTGNVPENSSKVTTTISWNLFPGSVLAADNLSRKRLVVVCSGGNEGNQSCADCDQN